MEVTTFGELSRGDQFIGEPHGGWIFIKTTALGLAVRIADGELISWDNQARVFRTRREAND